jgi:hypothetical protein
MNRVLHAVRHFPAQARASVFGPRRMSFGARIAVLALVLFAVTLSAYTRNYVDSRAISSAARACTSYGADEASNNADRDLYELLLEAPHRSHDEGFRQRLQKDREAKVQSAQAKHELRAQLSCPPYPPPPAVPAVGA